ncbi:HAD family phosphatase [Piscinibacter gummiphilus]|uniref:HAD family phosphatase n=1 Tax=Piscinibacter gummiphilus TaxID=946333 RepID=A0ABZ0CUZ7_9BURK|nr:HAD family phosphatase [Piscinibacter gummiphilus]WOB06780.1 HAD family phosphatase [Piscinibacter gummiphilus]
MNLCLFDLDDTLIPLDSDHAWGRFMIRQGWVDAEEFDRQNDVFFAHYKAGTLDIHAYIAFATAPWRERPASERSAAQDRFMQEVIAPQMRPAARDLVQHHQQQGDLVAIVTATNEFVTAPIARAFGVAHLLAVELEKDPGGNITGRIAGVPSFREGKTVRTHEWLAALGHKLQDFERVSVYSDSANDLPLLEMATDPVATNPSAPLEAIARERGWRILRLFD